MSELDALKQQVKGDAQKMEGDAKVRAGNVVDGELEKMKGSVNKAIGNAKQNTERNTEPTR